MKENLDIKIMNETITQRQSVKFLGVFVDQNLNWKEHIRTIFGKISGKVYRNNISIEVLSFAENTF